MQKISFNIDKLQSIIGAAKASANSGQRREFTNTAFLPDGTHKMRFFLGPDNELFRDVKMYQFKGKKTLSPQVLNRENEKNPEWPKIVQAMKPEWKEQEVTKIPLEDTIDKAAKEINNWKSGLSLKGRTMVYAKVYATNKEDQYWKPDNVYAVIGKKKLKDAILAMLESLAADSPDYIISMLNPSLSGGMVTVNVTGGTQGAVTITPIPGSTKDPILTLDETGKGPEWWRPLDEVFIGKDFNLKAWEEAEAEAQKILAEWREKKANGTAPSGDGDGDGEGSSDDKEGERSSTSQSSQSESQQSSEVKDSPKEDPKPEVKTEVKSEPDLASNQRKCHTGRVVTLPDIAIQDNCWKGYDAGNIKCISCPVNIECMSEQAF
ncbi:hypothetical protein EVB95_225 [Rhizobium phage RHph_TM2_3B]|nr:hypothetical protein EVB95_225 [Rhizobium phage RHph_TM2_3B]